MKVSEAFGMKKTHVMFRQILPNILTPITVSVNNNHDSRTGYRQLIAEELIKLPLYQLPVVSTAQ